jgi:predicted TIM-barrel fold metal-dependent hydrolase
MREGALSSYDRSLLPIERGASRRAVLKTLAAAGATAVLPTGSFNLGAEARAAAPKGGRIDVHHHILPSFYMQLRRAETPGDGRVFVGESSQWTPAKSVEELDKHDISTAMLSLAVGGLSLNSPGEESRNLGRKANDFGAQMVRDYPGRFGLMASLPLPDQDGSLREIEYAYEVLKADGIALLTDYGDKWPGDPVFAPAFEELNRRKAVVFVHPSVPTCCTNLIPGTAPTWEEYLFDTARAITSFLLNNTFTRFPEIRFIFCHSGGTLPVLANRISTFLPDKPGDPAATRVANALKRQFWEVAGASAAPSLAALTKLVPLAQILFGSDYPFVLFERTISGLEQYGLSKADLRAINRENAERLFPRLKG